MKTKDSLLEQINLLDTQVVMLKQGLEQSAHIRKFWAESKSNLEKTKVRLEEAEKRLRLSNLVVEHSTEGIMVTDEKSIVKVINSAFTDITGYAMEETINKKPSFLSAGRHDEQFYQAMWKVINEEKLWQGEIWNRHKDGRIYPAWLTICAVYDKNNEVSNYIGIFSDISQQKESEDKLKRLATHDGLTDLPNKLLFQDRLSESIKHSIRQEKLMALFFMDLDYFKQVNDTYGHTTGDLLLQEVTKRIKKCLREEDTIARVGGDEFTAIVEDVVCKRDAIKLANKIINIVSKPYLINNKKCKIGMSVGVSFYPDDAKQPAKLIKLADAAMYAAKEAGRNCLKTSEQEQLLQK